MFEKEIYIRRRATLIERMGAYAPEGKRGIAIFIGNVDAPAQYRDNAYAFRQDSTWLYYFGIDLQGYAAIIDLDSAAQTIYADDVDIDDVIWSGPQPSVRSIAEGVGVTDSAPAAAFGEAVRAAVAKGREVHFIPPSRYYNTLRLRDLSLDPSKSSEALVKAIISMRLVKEDVEIEQMDNAVKDGAKVIVMAGYLFAPALEEAQAKYPDISFLALDVSTGDLAEPAANTALITYKEEQAGYLAGYAAVTDGYKKLGFLGGMAVPAVIRYGYGFIQGANQAAADLGVSDVTIKYWYSGSFQANDDIKAKMDSWYSDGTEVVFACGGSICNSCVAAAQANNGKMIGVDVDQSPLDSCVITSAMKALSNSVVVCLTDAQGNGWKFTDAYAGKETTLGAAEDCVGLPMETSQFTTFTQEQYDELFGKMASGELVIDNSSDAAVKPAVTNVTVDYQD